MCAVAHASPSTVRITPKKHSATIMMAEYRRFGLWLQIRHSGPFSSTAPVTTAALPLQPTLECLGPAPIQQHTQVSCTAPSGRRATRQPQRVPTGTTNNPASTVKHTHARTAALRSTSVPSGRGLPIDWEAGAHDPLALETSSICARTVRRSPRP
ncbi:hypothetical protein E2C01_059400 [Portunus trituberculatus]|uniref:Uncharacterized protein n=1 Tax=Portunus trituberculatus TaxID=210409 RepID=A0A5B7H5Q8_PORTR|nr:hypothetical protein [Portunus trituberculatus]